MSLVEPAAVLSIVVVFVSGICAVAVAGVSPVVAFPMAAVWYVSVAMATAQFGLAVVSLLRHASSVRDGAR